MNKLKHPKWLPVFLVILSGLLMWAGWPPHRLPFLLFVGFVPIFYLEYYLIEKGKKIKHFFWWTYLALFIWNFLTTWWVAYASFGGAVFMLLANTLIMVFPFWAYSFTKKIAGMRNALFAFLFYWLAFEYFHFRWELAYPWLTLGNGFATFPSWVQWYEYTGLAGGSLWIISFSALVFYTLLKPQLSRYISILVLLLAPIAFSYYIKSKPLKVYDVKEIVVLQPNIDPYKKFESSNYEDQVRQFLSAVKDSVTPQTDLLVFPETALVDHINEDHINQNPSIRILTDFIRDFPNLKILTGASTHRFYKEGEKRALTARKTLSGDYYESYNTALLVGSNGVEQIYHKSRLVPGVEKMPYPEVLGFLEKLSINMGGISGSLAADPEPSVFRSDSFGFAPLICYESVFGNYVNQFVERGSDLLFVITNDGWWKETDGHRHHKDYARLRAIENRREVVRSANTGISCHIDAYGNVYRATKWWETAVFRTQVKLYRDKTYYSEAGDGLGRVSSMIGVLVILSVVVRNFTRKKSMLS